MKIKELQISNILSFKYFENILDASKIAFDNDLNIFIGENGAGKSTALEILNFIFKKVLFTQFIVNQQLYSNKNSHTENDKKQILLPDSNSHSFTGLRLEPNWNSEDNPQKIRLVMNLDEIDIANIEHLITNQNKILNLATTYSSHFIIPAVAQLTEYVIEITLHQSSKTFTAEFSPPDEAGYRYLVNYNYFKELINIYNLENPQDLIAPLYESFSLIGGYRNYHSLELLR